MTRSACHLLLAWLVAIATVGSAAADQIQNPAAFVRSILNSSASEMDFARAKLAVDKFVDPMIDETVVLADLDRMAAAVGEMLATLPPARLRPVLRK